MHIVIAHIEAPLLLLLGLPGSAIIAISSIFDSIQQTMHYEMHASAGLYSRTPASSFCHLPWRGLSF
jgi:hypothetical protein